MFSLLKNTKTVRVSNAVAAGTSDINSTGVNMAGYQTVTFFVLFGAITATAVTSVKAQQSDDDGATDDYDDLENTAITVADSDDDKVAIREVVRPQKDYVRCVVDRGTADAVIDGIIAVLSNPRSVPVTQPSSVLGSESHVSPDEGAA